MRSSFKRFTAERKREQESFANVVPVLLEARAGRRASPEEEATAREGAGGSARGAVALSAPDG